MFVLLALVLILGSVVLENEESHELDHSARISFAAYG